jgi:aspartate oxidase
MARYDPSLMERTFRGKLVMAVQQEILEGRGPILMDARSIDPQSHIQIEDVRRKLRAGRINMRRELFPWVPAAHTFLGGARIDKACSTSIRGISVCGP